MMPHRLISVSGALAIAMIVSVIVAWQITKNAEELRIQFDADRYLNNISARLETHISSRLIIGKHVCDQWLLGKYESEESFRHEMRGILKYYPDFQAINWIDPKGIIRWVVPYEGNVAALGLNIQKLLIPNVVLEESERTGHIYITPPTELAQGGNGIVAFFPMMRNGSLKGLIDVVFRAKPLIDAALKRDVTKLYHLKITDGKETVFDTQNMLGPHLHQVHRQIKVGNHARKVVFNLKKFLDS